MNDDTNSKASTTAHKKTAKVTKAKNTVATVGAEAKAPVGSEGPEQLLPEDGAKDNALAGQAHSEATKNFSDCMATALSFNNSTLVSLFASHFHETQDAEGSLELALKQLQLVLP
jgi:hypothetical protein